MSIEKKRIAVKCTDCTEEYDIITESDESISYCIFCGSFIEPEEEDIYTEEYGEYDE